MILRKHLSRADLETHKIVYLSPGHAPSMVTTIGPAKNVNIATFEQTMIVSYSPPRIIIAVSPKSDTHKNLRDGSDCVVGFPNLEHIQYAYDAGVKAPRDISELALIEDLSVYDSTVVKSPSISQCWINFECTISQIIPCGDHDIALLDVVHVSLEETVWKDDPVERRTSLPAVYYTTAGHFFTPGNSYHVQLSEPLTRFDNGD